ncbi:MAG: metallophosphoesterase [Ignavibacteriales bacterium]|nr:metallophosphoesterase [Ignavibacteriales bacterium]
MPWTLAFALVVFFPIAAMNFYVWRKVFKALCELTTWDRRWLRNVSVGFHVWVTILPFVYAISYLIVGRRAIPAFAGDSLAIDLLFSYPFWIALVIVAQLFMVFALLDFIEFAILRFVLTAQGWFRRNSSLIYVVLAVSITPYSLVTIARDTWSVRVVEHKVVLPPEFRSLHGFRIAQISDVQEDGRTTPNDLRKYVATVNSLRPDIVLFAGDLVTSGTRYIESAAEIMGGLRSRFGTIAAVGDHEIFSDKPMVLDALGRRGVKVVEDSTIVLNVDSARVAISVVTYTYLQRPRKRVLERLTAGMDETYWIFLVHQPAEELVQFARQNGYNLFVAGHTHGGGLAFGVPGLFLFAPATLESNYVSGLFQVGQMAVSVTNGLGLTLTPIRFNAPAEITLLNLEQEGAARVVTVYPRVLLCIQERIFITRVIIDTFVRTRLEAMSTIKTKRN